MDQNTRPGLLAIILLCFCFIASSHAQTVPAQQKSKHKTKVATDYNKLSDETTASIGPFGLLEQADISISEEIDYERVNLSVLFSYRGKNIVKPKVVTLLVFSLSHAHPSFDKRREVAIATESRRFSFGDAELVFSFGAHVERTALGPVNRLLVRELLRKPFDDFAGIARSLKVTLRLGDREFKLTKQQIEACRDFVSLMEQEGLEF